MQYSFSGCLHSVFACEQINLLVIMLVATWKAYHRPTQRIWLVLDIFNARLTDKFPCFIVNIHSHLWAAVLFLGFLVTANDHHIAQYPTAMWLDRAAFAVFLVMAVFCLLCSATFHAVACHSQEIARQYNALDYAGIICEMLWDILVFHSTDFAQP